MSFLGYLLFKIWGYTYFLGKMAVLTDADTFHNARIGDLQEVNYPVQARHPRLAFVCCASWLAFDSNTCQSDIPPAVIRLMQRRDGRRGWGGILKEVMKPEMGKGHLDQAALRAYIRVIRKPRDGRVVGEL